MNTSPLYRKDPFTIDAIPEAASQQSSEVLLPKKAKKGYEINAFKYLDEVEFKQLMYNLNKVRRNNKISGDVALLYALIYTGARVTEVLNLRREDLLTRMAIFVRGLKGSKNREIPVPQRVYWTIHSYMLSHDKPMIFPFGYTNAMRIWLNWRPSKKRLHCLRHTFAIRLYKRTRDLRLVQVALGHKSIHNTMVYADYMYQYSEMRKLMLGRTK